MNPTDAPPLVRGGFVPSDDVDVVRALLLRIKAALLAGPVTDQTLLDIELAVRHEYGGEARYVGRQVHKTVRDEWMSADLAAGLKPSEVARRHGVSVRTVQRLRATCSGDRDAL